jgi:hypothetical protein
MQFKVTCRCTTCGHRWIYRTKHPDRPDPPCPNLDCGVQGEPIGMDLTLNKAPAAIGGNIQVKAIDETAKIVMEDYGMTDLRSDVRETESAAPKLPPVLQRQADNFFGGGPKGQRRSGSGMPINLAAHARAALAGGLRDPRTESQTIGAAHRTRMAPPVLTVATERGPA